MAVTVVMMDTAQPVGSKLDAEMQAEIEKLSPAIETGEVGTPELADAAVTRAKLGAGAVGGVNIGANEIGKPNMAPSSVGTAELIDGQVTGAKAGPGVVSAVDASGNFILSRDWIGTAAQYAAIAVPDPNTNYYVQ